MNIKEENLKTKDSCLAKITMWTLFFLNKLCYHLKLNLKLIKKF